MDMQRFRVNGQVLAATDPRLQDALARVHETPDRPRCLCVPGGPEMYVVKHAHMFVPKRMPGTGSAHHPICPSFEPQPQQSGLGELVGEAIREYEPGRVELRVDFAWARMMGRGGAHDAPRQAAEGRGANRRIIPAHGRKVEGTVYAAKQGVV